MALWYDVLALTSQTLLIMGASMSPALSGLLPSVEVTDGIITDVIASMARMVHLSPSIKLAADLMQEASERRRMYLARYGQR